MERFELANGPVFNGLKIQGRKSGIKWIYDLEVVEYIGYMAAILFIDQVIKLKKGEAVIS